MKSYQSADDLRKLGINILTGEACGLGMRVLCDLNEDGIKLWEAFTRSSAVCDPWNEGKASVMIPRCMFEELWIFGQVMNGMRYVFLGGYVWGKEWTETSYTVGYGQEYTSPRSKGSVCNPDEPIIEKMFHPVKEWRPTALATNDDGEMERIRFHIEHKSFFINRFYAMSAAPGTGLDNRHAFSGRTV